MRAIVRAPQQASLPPDVAAPLSRRG